MDGGWSQQKVSTPTEAVNGSPSIETDQAADIFVRPGSPMRMTESQNFLTCALEQHEFTR